MSNPKQIIWLTGMPRSGTNWLSQFFAASPYIRVKFCPLFSYAFKNKMSLESTPYEWEIFFKQVYRTEDEFMDQLHLSNKGFVPVFSNKEENPETLFIKSNRFHNLTEDILKKSPNIRFIALVRNPLAAINSWLTNPNEFPENENPIKQWRTGECRKRHDSTGEFWGFDDWKKVTSLQKDLEKRYSDRFFLYRYEKILNDPFNIAKNIFDKLDLKFTKEVEDFILLSTSQHDNNPKSIYKSNIDPLRWKNQLSDQIINEIRDDINGTELEEFIR